MRATLRRLGPAGLLLGAALGWLGCARPGDAVLVIASGWPESERGALETAFRRWLEAAPGPARGPVRIAWIALMPGDDLTRVVRRRAPLDLVLGGPASCYVQLAREARLVPVGRAEHPEWCVVRRSPIGTVVNREAAVRGGKHGAGPSEPRQHALTFDDPRHDPIALAWAKGLLDRGDWAAGYAQLVRYAGHPRRIGRQEGSALAAVARGEAPMAPAIAPQGSGGSEPLAFIADSQAPEWIEGVALVRGGRHLALAQEFLRFLGTRGRASLPPDGTGMDLDADMLLADLLGATLVDAQDELWAAWAMLERTGRPRRAEMWMTQAPPWPPASVAKLLGRDQESPLVETLADEVAPDAAARDWLRRSWRGPQRLIDGPFLAELAGAADGRLAREPRFRAWLRGEWTAWARQRYRRVARLAGGARP